VCTALSEASGSYFTGFILSVLTIITSAIAVITGCFIKLQEILWKFENSLAMGNFATRLEILWTVENCGPY